MNEQYYYIVCSLPELAQEDKSVPYSAVEFSKEIRELLAPADRRLFDYLFLPIDNRNLLSLLEGKGEETFEAGGTLSLEELQEGLAYPELLPHYFRTFVEKNRDKFDSLSAKEREFALLQAYTNWKLQITQPFLRAWYSFETNLHNILAALNCREFQMDLEGQIIGDYPEAELLRSSRDRDFKLTGVLDYIETVMSLHSHPNLMVREMELLKLKWRLLDSLSIDEYFSIVQILSFTLKLALLERSTQMIEARGQVMLRHTLENLKKNFSIPEQFALSHT